MTRLDEKSLARAKNLKKSAELTIKRVKSGLKSSWVASRIGISGAMLCYLESGRSPWTPELEAKFLKVIGEK